MSRQIVVALGGSEHMILGSVSDKVVRHAPGMIAVVSLTRGRNSHLDPYGFGVAHQSDSVAWHDFPID